ncbi:MAG: phosphotransferase [Actinomycetota bacterium]
MSSRVPAVDAASLAMWCTDQLGSPPAAELFRSGHLSAVIGLRLADKREVVVKVRPALPRIAACVEVQRRMFESGYPCPEPLSGPAPLGNGVATAEAYVPGGDVLPGAEHAAQLSAEAFARLIELAPRPADVSSLDPAPSWGAWNHGEAGLWPRPEGAEVDLNQVDGPEWIDRAAGRARDRLRAGLCEAVIGHCDWLADNLRWRGEELLVVHDWDSAVADSEAILVGFAAALYSTVSPDELATVEETDRFLDAYCHARTRAFSPDELQRSWAAGVWTRAYDAKYQHVAGHAIASLSQAEGRARLRRAGID